MTTVGHDGKRDGFPITNVGNDDAEDESPIKNVEKDHSKTFSLRTNNGTL
jgi:hypothetical protein